MILQSVFEQWGESIKIAWQNADPVEVWGIVLLILGIVCVMMLIIFTEYKRKERESIKFTAITIVFASIFLGLGINLILISNGLW